MPPSLLIHISSLHGSCKKVPVIGKHGILESLSFQKFWFASNQKVEGAVSVEGTKKQVASLIPINSAGQIRGFGLYYEYMNECFIKSLPAPAVHITT